MNRRLFLRTAAIAAALLVGAGALLWGKRNDFGLGRNIEIAVNMMRELSLYYVDEIDPDHLMEGAAEGMVGDLDPYTEYMPEEQMSSFELLTTGKYGGVGALSRHKDDYVIIARPYTDSPAARAGPTIRDRCEPFAGEDARGLTTDKVSARLKGTPGSTVKVPVERLLDGSRDEGTHRRERIALPAVASAGWPICSICHTQPSASSQRCTAAMPSAVPRPLPHA